LLAKGADVNIFGGRLDSALQACIDNGNLEILELLLSHGADMNHEGGLYHSPLHCATYRGKTRAAEILLDRGALFNDEIYLMAVEYEHPSLISRILAKGVDVNSQNKKGTALQLAIKNQDTETINFLLSNKEVDIDARGGEYGSTALHLALQNGNEEIARRLILMGASVNLEGGDFYKPLTAAVLGKNENLIRLVLDSGADVNGHRGGWYESALNCACRRGLRSIVGLLLDHGADVTEFSGRENRDGSKYYQTHH
jgi:ankyrin repeat protein